MKRIFNFKPVIIIILFAIIFILNNCDKHDCPPGGFDKIYYHLSEDTLKIPYTGHDTLSFLKQTNTGIDTVIFIGQGKKHFTISEYDEDVQPCAEEYVNSAYEIKFIDDKNSDSFLLKIRKDINVEKCEYYYHERHFYIYLRHIGDSFWIPFFNFITFNGESYLRVSTAFPRDDKGLRDMSKLGDTLYINKYCGIVRIALDSGQYSLTYLK